MNTAVKTVARIGAAALSVALAASVAACSGTASTSSGAGGGDSTGPITLGTIDALTGAYAVLGAQVKDGVQAAVDSVNKSGGVLGRQLELVSLDNQSSATVAQQQVSQLLSQHKAVAVLNPEDATSVAATAPVAARLGIPQMSSSAAWPNGLSPDVTMWTWSATANTTDGIDRYIDYFTKNGIKSVALIGNGTPFSQQLAAYLKTKDSLPFTIVANEQFSPGASDVSPQLLRAISAKPQFVMSWVSGTDQVNVLKTYQRLGSAIPLGINGGNAGSGVRKAVGDEALDGVFALSYPTQLLDALPKSFPNRDAAQKYLDAMSASGLDADRGASNAVLGYDAAMSMIQAIKDAGSTDPAAIQKALQDQVYVGAATTFKRAPDNHSGAQPGGYVLSRSKGSDWNLELAYQAA